MISKVHLKEIGGFLCVLVLSLYTYIPGYQKPALLFWDENFHIASAQRYLNNVFFLEPHPPLGKLVIAAGEYLFKFNSVNNQFISEEKADEIPDGFSFAGYRLFPVIFAALIAPLIYLIILKITQNYIPSFTIALAPTFDNAMIVHNRGAMLESTQIFFLLLSVLTYLHIYSGFKDKFKNYILLGIFCSLSIVTKINSLPILILPLFLLFYKKQYGKCIFGFVLSFIVTYLIIWQTHFLLARNINKELDGDGLFGVSKSYENVIASKNSSNPLYLLQGISESFSFFARYQKGVPVLDYTKEDENGSSPMLWPIGARTINYRWQQDGNEVRYLYLVPNIASWLLGLLGVILCFYELFKTRFLAKCNNNLAHKLIPFCIIYLVTWLSPILMNRVFYLYHYFVPLSFSWIILGCSLNNYKNLSFKYIKFTSIIAIIVGVYYYFSPLTYYQPITNVELNKRAWIKYWDLRCYNCPSIYHSKNFISETNVTSDKSWQLSISGLSANYIEQNVGTPIQEGKNLEVQTQSKVQFPSNNNYTYLRGTAKLSQSRILSEVTLKIISNGKTIWQHTFTPSLLEPKHIGVSVDDSTILTLTAQTNPINSESVGVIWQDLELVTKDGF